MGEEKWTAHQIGTAGLHNETPVFEIRDQFGEVICTVSGAAAAAKIAAAPSLVSAAGDVIASAEASKPQPATLAGAIEFAEAIKRLREALKTAKAA